MTRFLAFCFLGILAWMAGEVTSGFVMGVYDLKQSPTVELRQVVRWPLFLLAAAWFTYPDWNSARSAAEKPRVSKASSHDH